MSPQHVAALARKRLARSKDFIGPRNYHYWLGENPPKEMIEAFRKGVDYVPKVKTEGFYKGSGT